MKKLSVLIISIITVFALAVSVCATTADASVKVSDRQVKAGESVVVTLSLKDLDPATSAYVEVTTPDALELVSKECKWLKDGMIKDFNGNAGTWAASSATDLNGDALQLVFKGKTASAAKHTISVKVIVRSGKNDLVNKTVTTEVTVVCASHVFGNWETTKAANCTESGNQTRKCSVCEVVENKAIAALGHKMDEWKVTKSATCDAAGEEERTCTNAGCTHKETRTVKALGHKFGYYKVTKESTCKEQGVETSTCSVCKKQVTRKAALKEHTFGEPTIVTVATSTSVGKQTKTCTACGFVVEEEIPMLEKDPTTEPVTEPTTEPTTEPATEPTTEPATEPVVEPNTQQGRKNFAWVWIILVVAAIGGGAIIIVLVKKKKD